MNITLHTLLNALQANLSCIPEVRRFCVAFSGGKDSHILLHALIQLSLHAPVLALHINHGLSPEADQWEQHCKDLCKTLKVPFMSHNISQALQADTSMQGVEATARTLRYHALASLLQAHDCLLTAHHEEDQAETVLLQLMRGSGVAGLASMPFLTQCEFSNPLRKQYSDQNRGKTLDEKQGLSGINERRRPSVTMSSETRQPATAGLFYHARPLLSWTKAHRALYAAHYQLQWIEDSSNQNRRFTRNFIRHEVLPLLQKRWESTVKTLTRTAKHCASAIELLSELAEEDLASIRVAHHILSISKLLTLSTLRQHNVLRYWIKQHASISPSEAQLSQITQLLHTHPGRTCPEFTWRDITLRTYRAHLYLLTSEALVLKNEIPLESWDLTSSYVVKGWGILQAERLLGQGLRCTSLTEAKLEIRFRQGGERFHPQGRSGSHPLKKLFQEWSIPPWERAHIPLLYYQNQLVAVAHYAVLNPLAAKSNELGFCIKVAQDSIEC